MQGQRRGPRGNWEADPDEPHGTRKRYRQGCRCDACRKAASESVMSYRKYDAEAKAKRAAQSLAWYYKNLEREREARRRYAKSTGGKVARAHGHTKRKGAPMPDDAKAFLPVLYADPCSYCGGPADRIDHITAIARGGTSDLDNLTAACRPCNSRKHAHSLLMFLLATRE
jgi:5-methylcytosine-specific restriction endonuclease McrA